MVILFFLDRFTYVEKKSASELLFFYFFAIQDTCEKRGLSTSMIWIHVWQFFFVFILFAKINKAIIEEHFFVVGSAIKSNITTKVLLYFFSLINKCRLFLSSKLRVYLSANKQKNFFLNVHFIKLIILQKKLWCLCQIGNEKKLAWLFRLTFSSFMFSFLFCQKNSIRASTLFPRICVFPPSIFLRIYA
jgi:hypothetical protein